MTTTEDAIDLRPEAAPARAVVKLEVVMLLTFDEPPTRIPATIGVRIVSIAGTAQPPIMRQEAAHHIWSRPHANAESHPASRMLDRPAVAKCGARYHFVTGADRTKRKPAR